MAPLTPPPGFITNVFTVGVVRALWVSRTSGALGHRTGFLFAWFLLPFANFGLTKRLNAVLKQHGSSHAESPVWCFLLTGWPLIGSSRRLRRAVARLNDTIAVRRSVPVPIPA